MFKFIFLLLSLLAPSCFAILDVLPDDTQIYLQCWGMESIPDFTSSAEAAIGSATETMITDLTYSLGYQSRRNLEEEETRKQNLRKLNSCGISCNRSNMYVCMAYGCNSKNYRRGLLFGLLKPVLEPIVEPIVQPIVEPLVYMKYETLGYFLSYEFSGHTYPVEAPYDEFLHEIECYMMYLKI